MILMWNVHSIIQPNPNAITRHTRHVRLCVCACVCACACFFKYVTESTQYSYRGSRRRSGIKAWCMGQQVVGTSFRVVAPTETEVERDHWGVASSAAIPFVSLSMSPRRRRRCACRLGSVCTASPVNEDVALGSKATMVAH